MLWLTFLVFMGTFAANKRAQRSVVAAYTVMLWITVVLCVVDVIVTMASQQRAVQDLAEQCVTAAEFDAFPRRISRREVESACHTQAVTIEHYSLAFALIALLCFVSCAVGASCRYAYAAVPERVGSRRNRNTNRNRDTVALTEETDTRAAIDSDSDSDRERESALETVREF